jgi:fatty acid amide hydrolase
VTTPLDTQAVSASELASRIAAGEVSAREAVEAHIRRIEAVNGRLNALVVPLFERARAEAALADARRAGGEALGPLHGVPVTIKEQFLVEGTPTTVGLPSERGHRAERDGPLVARLRAAGAIVLGKTNVPQLLYFHETDSPVYGRAQNPWNLLRSPGGSSGGEGALIAAGGSPLGLSSDIGGSIRVPAHFCGVHGFKPTSGRLTTLDGRPDLVPHGQEAIITQAGPMARDVAGLTLAMRVLAAPGQEALDPSVPPVAWPEPGAVSVGGLRIAVYEDDGYFPAAPALRRATREAAGALRERGARVEEWRPPDVREAIRVFLGLLAADGAAWARKTLGDNPRDPRINALVRLAGLPGPLRPPLARVADRARQRRLADMVRGVGGVSARGYWGLIAARNRYRVRFLEGLDAGGYDALICPPHALPALTHGAGRHLATAASYSELYNLLGMPAGVVAATRVRPGEESDRPRSLDGIERAARAVERGSAGLPVGVQVAARAWRDDVALAVMAALEEHFRARPDYPAAPPL